MKDRMVMRLWLSKDVVVSFKKYLVGAWKIVCIFLIFSILSVISVEASEPVGNLSKDLTDLSIEDLMKIEVATVYGASKFEQKVTEAPSSVSIVTADEIKKYGYRTLADILRSLRGFQVTSDRNYSYVALRGVGRTGDYNGRFLLLIDGHRVNENIYDSVYVEKVFILDIDLIERIEVIRGPSSSIYGNNAFFAVINIITRKGRDLKGFEASGSAGSFDTYTGRFSFGNVYENGLEMIASGSLLNSKGQNLFFKEFDNPTTNFGVAQGCDRERNYTLFSNLSFHDFSLEGAYVSRTKGIPTASFGTDFNDPRNATTDERGYLDLKYDHSFADRSRIIGHLSYDTYDYHGDYISSGVVNKDFSNGEWWAGEVMFTKILMERHKLTVGAEYQINSKQDQGDRNENPPEILLDDKRRSRRWALYIQDEFTIFKKLILNAGMRYDHYSTFGGTSNPRLALIYHPLEKTAFKLIYGTAFRAPNVYELHYSASPNKGNPDLKPEKIKAYELICEQSLGDTFFLTIAGFKNKLKDLIDQQVDPADNLIVFRNVNKVETKGIELELEGRWHNGLTGRLSYSLQEAKDTTTGKILINSPKHMAKLNLIVPLLKEKVFAGLEEQYMSKRKTLAGREIEGFFVTNLTIFSKKLVKGLEVSASVYNLFDEKYGDPGSTEHVQDVIEQDGRSFRFKITFDF